MAQGRCSGISQSGGKHDCVWDECFWCVGIKFHIIQVLTSTSDAEACKDRVVTAVSVTAHTLTATAVTSPLPASGPTAPSGPNAPAASGAPTTPVASASAGANVPATGPAITPLPVQRPQARSVTCTSLRSDFLLQLPARPPSPAASTTPPASTPPTPYRNSSSSFFGAGVESRCLPRNTSSLQSSRAATSPSYDPR